MRKNFGRLAIVGAGGHAKVAADIAEQLGWTEVTLFDDYKHGHVEGAWLVEGDFNHLLINCKNFDGFIVAIGDSEARSRYFNSLKNNGLNIVSLIHPRSIISKYAEVGSGVIGVAGCVVNAYASIGNGVILNTSSTVGHDCIISDFSHVAPGSNIAGNVNVGSFSWIGAGSVIIQKIKIGANVVVGAGSVVIKNIPDKSKVAGSPAKNI